jgi:hypothetical protein
MKFSLVLALCAIAVRADPEDPVLPPIAWPSQHTHLEVRCAGPPPLSKRAAARGHATHPRFAHSFFSLSPPLHTAQIQYTIDNGAISEKPVFYDYTNLHYRADGYLLNSAPFATKNLSSYWLGNDLFIYTFDINNCVHLDLGFGMMRPTWFMDNNASIFGSVCVVSPRVAPARYAPTDGTAAYRRRRWRAPPICAAILRLPLPSPPPRRALRAQLCDAAQRQRAQHVLVRRPHAQGRRWPRLL